MQRLIVIVLVPLITVGQFFCSHADLCRDSRCAAHSSDSEANIAERSHCRSYTVHAARPHIHLAGKHRDSHAQHSGHGHSGHGHDEHGHDEHGHDEHGHDGHGHDEHGHSANDDNHEPHDAFYFPCVTCENRILLGKRAAGVSAPVIHGWMKSPLSPPGGRLATEILPRAIEGGPPLYLRVLRLRI